MKARVHEGQSKKEVYHSENTQGDPGEDPEHCLAKWTSVLKSAVSLTALDHPVICPRLAPEQDCGGYRTSLC